MKSFFLFLIIVFFPFISYSFSYKNLMNPYAVTLDDAGYIYITCRNGDPLEKDSNGYVTKLNPDGSINKDRFLGELTGAGLHAPTGIVISRDVIFIADLEKVKIFDRLSGQNTGQVDFAKNKVEPKHVFGLTIGPDKAIYATDALANAVYRIDPVTYVASVLIKSRNLGQPHSIVWNSGKLLFLISSWENGNIMAIDIKGKISSMPEISLSTLEGMTQDMSGTIYVSSQTLGSVFRLDPQFAINPYANGLGSVAGIVWSKKGELLAVLPLAGEIISIPRK